MKTMKHLDLFTGIGGFKLAAEWSGFETVAFCEVNDWCDEHALKENWPDIPNLKDVRKLCRRIHHILEANEETEYDPDYLECNICEVDFGECDCIGTDQFLDTYGGIDLITAGVPCQPASIIGKRKGADDARWLWPDTLRIVGELEPTWVVCENPTGLLTLDKGDRFDEILKGFHEIGYDCWWETLPATSVGAGHRRERVWLVAYSRSQGLERHAWNGNSLDRPHRGETGKAGPTASEIVFPLRDTSEWWKDQSPVPVVVDGVSDPSFWKEAVIATGNAIVPQVAYSILKSIAELTERA